MISDSIVSYTSPLEVPFTKLPEHKYDEVPSPSTDYTEFSDSTDGPSQAIKDDMREKSSFYEQYAGHSNRYWSEISAFEPLSESMQVFSFDWESGSQRKVSEIERKDSEGESPQNIEETGETEESSQEKEWCEKKDKILKNLASRYKYDWKKITMKFNESQGTEMTPVALKQRYKELNKVPIPLRVKFSHEEDLMIAKYFETYGCNWVQIATHFNDRSPMMLKNRYYSFIRKKNLLTSMLEEVKCGKTVEYTLEDDFEDPDTETIQIIVENSQGLVMRKMSMNRFNNVCPEVENALASELHDRITFTSF